MCRTKCATNLEDQPDHRRQGSGWSNADQRSYTTLQMLERTNQGTVSHNPCAFRIICLPDLITVLQLCKELFLFVLHVLSQIQQYNPGYINKQGFNAEPEL